jgi:hypothetical protein
MGPVGDAIAATRHELQRDSLELGTELFDDPAPAFVARLETAWGDDETF